MEKKKKKYVSIRQKVEYLVIGVALIALALDSAVGLLALNRVQKIALESEYELAVIASRQGEEALQEQAEQGMLDLVNSKSRIAEGNLEKFVSYMESLVFCAENLYNSADRYEAREVLPPDRNNQGIAVMQRCLRDSSVSYEEVRDEMGQMAYMEDIFAPIFEKNHDIISTIYMVTESGYMLNYDENSDMMDQGMQEEYYDFSQTEWYQLAKEAEGVAFSNAYQDAFGRGMTVTCVSPFYAADGTFAGAICMDLLVKNLNDNITDVNMGESSYVILVDQDGNIIASPLLDDASSVFENIRMDENSKAYEAADRILSGETGMMLTSGDIYYAYAPVEQTDWRVVLHVDATEVKEPINEIHKMIENSNAQIQESMENAITNARIVFLFNLIVMCIVVLILSRVFAKRLTKPLIEMKNAVKNIRDFDANIMVNDITEDELSDLAKAFNNLRSDLAKYVTELTRITAEKERIGAELDVATRIQADMLPSIFPPFPDRKEFALYATMNPAKEVGGDFYDFFMVDDNHLALVMADVSGKGVPAALFMVIAKTLIKNAAQMGLSAKETLEKVNKQLCENNKEEMFVTVWLGIMDIPTGVLRCANAGHEFPAVCKKGGAFELFKDKHGLVLAGVEGSKYREYELCLESGDMLFVYTDGVPEATNAKNELYGTERMLTALTNNSCIETILENVRADVDAFVGEAPQFDDLTMLVIQYFGLEEKSEDNG